MKTVGFIGIGIMGSAMVRNLMKAGFSVTIYARKKEKATELLAEGALWADSVAECAMGKDAVISIVGYPADVESVYFGQDGILENAAEGTIVIDATTSTPELAKRIYDAALARKISSLDAPVTGGEVGAINGTLAIMVGGDEAAFDRAYPLFEAMGNNIRFHGAAGNGQHCKMANQIGVACAIAGVCEVAAYAQSVGLDVTQVFESVKTGSASSAQMNMLSPKILAGDDRPSFYLKHLLKDLSIVLDEAAKVGRTLPQAESITAAYRVLSEQGFGELGTQALRHFYDLEPK